MGIFGFCSTKKRLGLSALAQARHNLVSSVEVFGELDIISVKLVIYSLVRLIRTIGLS